MRSRRTLVLERAEVLVGSGMMRASIPKSIGSEKVRTLSAQLNIAIEKMFISKCQLELPKKEEMRRFIEDQVREAES